LDVRTADPGRSSRDLERLVRAVQELALARDLAAIQAVVRWAARELVGADGATFVLRDGDRCHYADEDAIAPLWKGQRFPMGACVSGWAMLHREAAVIPDIYADARIPHDAYRPTFVRSLVMVPIRTADPVGAIGTYWAAPHAATPWEVGLLCALADSTSVAMENVRVHEELEARVRVRTAELEAANAAIREQLAELEAANVRADRIFAALAEALPGTVLDDKFRLDTRIGAGGYGVVFRGTWLTESRPVAVKVFQPRPGNDSPEASERFLREGAWASRVRHPNAVEVYEYGISSDGMPYLVMELLEGRTLKEELDAASPLPVGRCAAILVPICAALEAAHARGVVHRDIKPDNIFLHRAGRDEVPKLLDFGLAKGFDRDTGDLMRHTRTAGSADFTRAGHVVGTPLFIAPERWLGTTDARGDVYSLGVVLYLMLCGPDAGQRVVDPHEATPFLEAFQRRQLPRRWPPVRSHRPDAPAWVEALVAEMLAADPAGRPTPAEVRLVLESADVATGVTSP